MKIRILAGVYGHSENGRVKPVRAGDPPIIVSDVIAARLIKAGVAAVVEEQARNSTVNDAGTVAVPETTGAADGLGMVFPEYKASMTRAQLEEIAEKVGIEPEEIKSCDTKADIISLLDDVKQDLESEDAPKFDPAGDML